MNEMPDGTVTLQPEIPEAPPAGAKKKPRVSLIVGIAVAAAALVAVAALFLLSYFSANSRFNRAMDKGDYEAAQEILSSNKLKASEINDGYLLTLADHYLDNFNGGKSGYEDCVQKLIELKSADIFDESTLEKIKSREESVIDEHVGEIFDAFCDKKIGYEDALKQINGCDSFGDDLAKSIIDEYAAKTEEKRDELYADALAMITDRYSDYTSEEITEALESFGDFRNAKTLAGIYKEIGEGNGVEAAKLLIDYKDMIESSTDVADAEASSDVFDSIKDYILDNCFKSENSDSDSVKLDNRIKSDFVKSLFKDDSGKITAICGNQSSRSMDLDKDLDLGWFSNCKGGTGKVLYLARYLDDSSFEPRDMFYYYRYENSKDIPASKMPESLEDVEYLVVYDEGGTFYNDYSTEDGDNVEVYQRTVHVIVRRYPAGDVLYDSGTLTGPTPPASFTVAYGTKYAYGEKPDLTDVIAKVKQTVGLS